MVIFTGLTDIVLFIILFVLIYCLSDSLIAQIILFSFAAYSVDLYVRTVMDGTNPDSVKLAFFFGVLMIYSLGNIAMWIYIWNKTRKPEESGV